MKDQSKQFLRELADLIERYQVQIEYTIDDDGVHFHRPDDYDFFHGFVDPDTTPKLMREASA